MTDPFRILSGTLFRLRDARTSSDMTQLDVAAALKVVPSTISHWESGSRDLSVLDLIRLCLLYKASIAWVLTGANPDFDAELTAQVVDEATEELQSVVDKLNKLKFRDVGK